MEWVGVRRRLTLAERHLDAALSASVVEVVRIHLQCAQEFYASAMSALDDWGLKSEEQRELNERMLVLSMRLCTLEHRSRRL